MPESRMFALALSPFSQEYDIEPSGKAYASYPNCLARNCMLLITMIIAWLGRSLRISSTLSSK